MADSIEMTEQQIKSKRTVFLMLSTLVLLFLGLIYGFSAFAKPMVQDFGIQGSISLTFNIMMIAFCTGCVGGSFVDKKIGVKGSLIVCAILFLIGFAGTGLLAASGGVMVLYIFYGVFAGLGCGVGYNTIVATTNVWFPDKVGFSSGVLMMGFGVSSLIFGNLALVLRPAVGGMGPILIIIGIIVTVLVVILAFRLQRPPKNIIAVMAPEKMTVGGSELGENDSILKTPIFYIYYVWGIITIAVGLAVIGNCAADASLLGVSDSFASLLVGLVATFNGLARIIIGAIYDKTNVKVTMFVDALVAVVAVALIVVAFTSQTSIFYIIGALLCGFAYGGVPVIASAFARQRYGAKKYPVNLSIVNFAIAFGSFLNIGVAAALGASNRLGIFTVILIFACISLVDVFLFSRFWKKDVEEAKA